MIFVDEDAIIRHLQKRAKSRLPNKTVNVASDLQFQSALVSAVPASLTANLLRGGQPRQSCFDGGTIRFEPRRKNERLA